MFYTLGFHGIYLKLKAHEHFGLLPENVFPYYPNGQLESVICIMMKVLEIFEVRPM